MNLIPLSDGCISRPTINMTFGAVNFDYRAGRFHRKVDGLVGIMKNKQLIDTWPCCDCKFTPSGRDCAKWRKKTGKVKNYKGDGCGRPIEETENSNASNNRTKKD